MKIWYIVALALEWSRIHRDLRCTQYTRWDEFWRIIRCYSEPHRFYHTLRHIYKTIRMARTCYPGTDSRSISWIVMALIYHDVVYAIGSKTNEDDSAKQWRRYASDRFDPAIVDWIDAAIIQTKSHKLGDDAFPMQKIMNDCDMAILASSDEDYLRYAQDVWREYRAVGKDAYRAGRLSFLKSLDVQDLFYTDVPCTYDAELNISTEIEILEDRPDQILVDD